MHKFAFVKSSKSHCPYESAFLQWQSGRWNVYHSSSQDKDMSQLFCNASPLLKTGFLPVRLAVLGSMVACLTSLPAASATASPYDYSRYSGAITNVNNPQPIIRWYRYYNSSGQPSLSSTITDQHLKYGYEALDRNMQVIKRVPPYSTESYARQKAKREAEAAKRQADINLRRTYGSVAQATAKRNQMLADMASRKTYLQTQLTGLQQMLGKDIAQAANYERQGKPVPAMLKKSITDNKKNVHEAQQNIQAINERQQQVIQQYDDILRRLKTM